MEFYQHQKELIADHPDRLLIAWECGTGKTAVAIGICQKHHHKTLIVGIKNNVKNWIEEIRMWQADFEYDIMTKEHFKRDHKLLPPYDCVIIDEAHYFSGRTSQCYKSMLWYLEKHNVRYRYLLTGTPYMSTPWNIYALATLLGHKISWQKFEAEYCTIWDRHNNKFYATRQQAIQAGANWWHLVPMTKRNIEKHIASFVNYIGVTKRLDDCIDMPASIFRKEYCFINAVQEKLIGELSPSVPIANITKIHQILGGTLKDQNLKFDCDKLHRLLELVKEYPKLIIVCRYTLEMEMIASKLQSKRVYMIGGKTKDPYTVGQQANNDPECILIINASCSEAQNLPNFDQVIFYSHSFSLKDYIQMLGRIRRANTPSRCVYTSLIVQDSIDEEVYKCVAVKKMDFQTEIFNKEQDIKKEKGSKPKLKTNICRRKKTHFRIY